MLKWKNRFSLNLCSGGQIAGLPVIRKTDNKSKLICENRL